MLTFKHFCDRPLWAAAGGYNFSFMDCLSVAAINIGRPFMAVRNITSGFLDWEVREVIPNLIAALIIMASAIIYPFTYWIFAIYVYFRCKSYARKHKDNKSETVIRNLEKWRESCDRRFNG